MEPGPTLIYPPPEVTVSQGYPQPAYPEPYVPPEATIASLNPTDTLPPPPTQTRYIPPPPPTVLPNVVETTPFHPTSPLPGGLKVNIYRMNQPVLAGAVGYRQVQNVLKDRMRQTEEFGQVIDQGYLDAVNEALSLYGRRIEPGRATSKVGNRPLFVLYDGDQTVFENMAYFSPVSINASRTDFMLNVELADYTWKQVRKDGVIDQRGVRPGQSVYEYWPDAFPQFLGDDVMTATMELESQEPVRWVRVYKNGEMR